MKPDQGDGVLTCRWCGERFRGMGKDRGCHVGECAAARAADRTPDGWAATFTATVTTTPQRRYL